MPNVNLGFSQANNIGDNNLFARVDGLLSEYTPAQVKAVMENAGVICPLVQIKTAFLNTDVTTTTTTPLDTGLTVNITPKYANSKIRITVSGFFRSINSAGTSNALPRIVDVSINRLTGTPEIIASGQIGRSLSSITLVDSPSVQLTSFCAIENSLDTDLHTYTVFIASANNTMEASLLGEEGVQATIVAEEILDD